MKNSKLLVIALAAALAFVIGCQNPKPRVTKLGDGAYAGDSARKDANLNTDPLAALKTDDGVTAGAVTDSSLPDDSSLADRDQDRSAFANETLYFEYDQSNVKAVEASKIDQVAGAFKAKGAGFDLLIEGHCDERGTEEYNLALGERRAKATAEFLAAQGIATSRVTTISYGKERPQCTERSEACWAKNRRAHFLVKRG